MNKEGKDEANLKWWFEEKEGIEEIKRETYG